MSSKKERGEGEEEEGEGGEGEAGKGERSRQRRKEDEGQGNDLVGKVLDLKEQGPEFHTESPHNKQKQDRAACAYEASTAEAGMGIPGAS